MTRSTSFAADQPDGKAQRLGSSCGSDRDDDMPDLLAGAGLAELDAQQAAQRMELEQRLQAQVRSPPHPHPPPTHTHDHHHRHNHPHHHHTETHRLQLAAVATRCPPALPCFSAAVRGDASFAPLRLAGRAGFCLPACLPAWMNPTPAASPPRPAIPLQREREEAYERALEARRQELAAQQAAQQAALLAAAAATLSAPARAAPGCLAGLPAGEAAVAEESSLAGSEGQDQPGTPDQQDDQPATPNAAQAAAAQAANVGACQNSSSGGTNSPELRCGGEHNATGGGGAAAETTGAPPPHANASLLAEAAGLASFQARPAAPSSLAQHGPFAGLAAMLGQPTSGSAATSLFAEAAPTTAGSSLFGSPALTGMLGEAASASPHSAALGSSLPSPMAGSPYLQGMAGAARPPARSPSARPPCGAWLPGPLHSGRGASRMLPCLEACAQPCSVWRGPPTHMFAPSLSPPTRISAAADSPTSARAISGRVGFGCHSPPGSAAPFPSPAGGGLPPQQRAGLPPLPSGRQPSLGGALTAGVGPAVAPTSPAEADHALSMHLQDALFVGSPGGSPASLAPLQRRQSLFGALTPRGTGGEAGDDADSRHLLSSSLSCLDDSGAGGESLLARHLSATGSGSGSGSMASAADQVVASLRQQPQAGWPGAGEVPDTATLLGGAAGTGSPTPRAAPLSPASSVQRALSGLAADPNGDESAEPTRHLWIGNLGTRTPRQSLKTIFEQ